MSAGAKVLYPFFQLPAFILILKLVLPGISYRHTTAHSHTYKCAKPVCVRVWVVSVCAIHITSGARYVYAKCSAACFLLFATQLIIFRLTMKMFKFN